VPKQADDYTKSVGRLVLVGMMGSGKTTVGRLVAQRLQVRFCDTDDQVEHQFGQPISSIFETLGEAAFRGAETEVLIAALQHGGPGVIATGGGIVLEEVNRVAMKRDATVVWLRAGVGTLTDRLGTGEGRPLLAAGTATETAARTGTPAGAGGELATITGNLAKIAGDRSELYEFVADAVVETDGLSPESVADAVIDAVDCLAVTES